MKLCGRSSINRAGEPRLRSHQPPKNNGKTWLPCVLGGHFLRSRTRDSTNRTVRGSLRSSGVLHALTCTIPCVSTPPLRAVLQKGQSKRLTHNQFQASGRAGVSLRQRTERKIVRASVRWTPIGPAEEDITDDA